MALKDLLRRLATPAADLDEERLREFCASRADAVPIGRLVPRQPATVVGEVLSLRIVPRPEGPWLEVTVTDGNDRMVAMWTGRRRIAGVRPGQRLMLSGRPAPTGPGGRLSLMNPSYELL